MFFLASKIFWLVFEPSHVLVWCGLAAALLLMLGRMRYGRIFAVLTAVLLLAIAVFPTYVLFGSAADHAYDDHPVPSRADGILVLGGGKDERVRLMGTYILARRYPTARVIYSGGSGAIGGEPDIDAAHARRVLLALGLEPSRLTLEGRSRNTWENLLFTQQMVKPMPGQVWILAVPGYQMSRAMAIARRLNWPLVPWPTDHYASRGEARFGALANNIWAFDNSVKEWVGMLAIASAARRRRSDSETAQMTDSYQCDAVVIGAGVVGLATARQLALGGRDVMVLEKNGHIGMETSARNSEVIHAGIYYPRGSLKAQLCARGKALLYEFCESHGVPYQRLGKLIVAGASQGAQLAAIAQAARDNDVNDLQPLSKADIAALEPAVVGDMGLFSPSTGIIDSHQYMLALLGERMLVRDATVTAARRSGAGWQLSVLSGGEEIALDTGIVVNAAGLWAQGVAARIEGLTEVPPLYLAKGNYASLAVKSPFSHLVYPVPEPGGLGVHVTLDMGGRARFGPNVQWLDDHDPAHIDYTVAPGIAAQFAHPIAQYWPDVRAEMLVPDYSGVRPKLSPKGAPNADFRIDGPSVHGLAGLVNLYGIESPGLTASLAIAEMVETLLT